MTEISVCAGGLDPRPVPPAGYLRLRAVDYRGIGLVAELGGTPTVAGGAGSHNAIDLPRREARATFAGRSILRLSLPLLLDLDRERGSVERMIAVLEQMHGMDDNLPAPPALIIEGIGVPHSYGVAPQHRWVLDGEPEYGDDVRYRDSADGQRSYITVTVSALRLQRSSLVAQPPAVASAKREFFEVVGTQQPRTIRTIARRFGKPWQQVAALNPKLTADPDRPLKGGTKVRHT